LLWCQWFAWASYMMLIWPFERWSWRGCPSIERGLHALKMVNQLSQASRISYRSCQITLSHWLGELLFERGYLAFGFHEALNEFCSQLHCSVSVIAEGESIIRLFLSKQCILFRSASSLFIQGCFSGFKPQKSKVFFSI